MDQQYLKDRITYNYETGVFTWRTRPSSMFFVDTNRVCKRWNTRYAGKITGYVGSDGYASIRIDDKLYAAHRLAWLYMTGEWPPQEVDHKNLNRNDNRWINLRAATHNENTRNGPAKRNPIGRKGIYLHKPGKWRARIQHHGKYICLGIYDCPAAAHLAYVVGSSIYHEEFGRAA